MQQTNQTNVNSANKKKKSLLQTRNIYSCPTIKLKQKNIKKMQQY